MFKAIFERHLQSEKCHLVRVPSFYADFYKQLMDLLDKVILEKKTSLEKSESKLLDIEI